MTKILSNKKTKRWFSVFVAFVLAVSLFPIMSNAYGEDSDIERPTVSHQEQTIPEMIAASEEANEDAADDALEGDPTTSDEDMTDGSEQSEDPNGAEAAAAAAAIAPAADPTWVTATNGASVTFENAKSATVTGNGAITVALAGNASNNYTLTINGNVKGNIDVPAKTTLNLKGTGSLTGKGDRSVIVVTGNKAKLVVGDSAAGKAGENCLTITGGSGSALTAEQVIGNQSRAGGAILVKRGTNENDVATLVINNVKIEGNHAQGGGAIYIDRKCSFTMNNGLIQNNHAKARTSGSGDLRAHEAGGIAIAGTATINKAKIVNNTTATTTDWGGGGIFIESKGSLSFGNNKVLITGNHASGLGGAISGCPHAKTGIGPIGNNNNAIAIYGNTADGTASLKVSGDKGNDALWHNSNGNGDIVAFQYDKGFTKDKAQDFYCTYASVIGAQNFLTNEGYSWTGRLAYKDKSVMRDVTIEEGGSLAVVDASLGLTAGTPVKAMNPDAFDVVIQGNESATHGGGIGSNGVLSIGSVPNESKTIDDWSVEFEKDFKKLDGASGLTAGKFTFGIYTDEACTQPVKVDGKALTATNDANGKVKFTLKGYMPSAKEKQKTYTFYVKEIVPDPADPYVSYDTAKRKIEVTVSRVETTSSKDDSGSSNPQIPWKITTINAEVDSVKHYVQKEDGSGYVLDEDKGVIFTNKVNPGSGEEFVTTPWNLEFTKSFKSLNDQNLFEIDADKLASMGIDSAFTFELYGAKTEMIDGAERSVPDTENLLTSTTNDGSGKVVFQFADSTEENPIELGNTEGKVDATQYRPEKEGVQTYTFFVKESVAESDRHPAIDYETVWHKVSVTVKTEKSERMKDPDTLTPTRLDVYTSSVTAIEYLKETEPADGKGDFEKPNGATFTNVYHPEGSFDLEATKFLYGDTANAAAKFGFTMVNILAPEDGVVNLNDSPRDIVAYHTTNGAFDENNSAAKVKFEGITFTKTGDDYWFMISEDEAEGTSTDPRIYVIRIAVDYAADGMSLVPRVTEMYYAEGITETPGLFGSTQTLELTKLDEVDGKLPTIEFANFDNSMQTMSLYGYAINAASDEPIDQECFVDPKIIKNLEGRSLMEGEFNFKLIELTPNADGTVDWSNTQGPTISETGNDRYGMVDFDKANNVSGDWENPSCLAYTAPGTYYYRVVEAKDATDPSVEYSQQIITFTTVIERDAQGQLECTDMYYGHVENGENIRYAESEDPQWHPTMTNYAKGMDLQVRKTSDLDREQGLEGATYGLYAVNNGDQADIFLKEAVSDADGWITFEDVSLTEGTLYYFKERLAPAGHTVSEFRSSYFYLVKDSTAPNGYAMHYTESKMELGSAEAVAEPVALSAMAEGEGEPIALDEQAPEGPRSDDGDLLFTFTRDGGVHDEATLVEFAKLDTRTHEWVEGADLSIIEKSTGKEVNRWTSGKASERLEGKLNVDTTYILRENAAPEGYAKAGDVEFTIDQYGGVKVLSGTSNGNAEIQDSTITLYDTMLDGEQVVTEYRETTDDEGSFLAKTGDFLKIAGIAALAIIGLLVLVMATRRARKDKDVVTRR